MTLHHHPPTHHTNSMSAISQLLLARFWWNFKGSFLGASRTDSNYQVNICPGNICPGDICPHQEYLSCYWLNFDQTLKVSFKKKRGRGYIWVEILFRSNLSFWTDTFHPHSRHSVHFSVNNIAKIFRYLFFWDYVES